MPSLNVNVLMFRADIECFVEIAPNDWINVRQIVSFRQTAQGKTLISTCEADGGNYIIDMTPSEFVTTIVKAYANLKEG